MKDYIACPSFFFNKGLVCHGFFMTKGLWMFGLPHGLFSVLRIKGIQNVGIFSAYSEKKKWVTKHLWYRYLVYFFSSMFSDKAEVYPVLVKQTESILLDNPDQYSFNYSTCREYIILESPLRAFRSYPFSIDSKIMSSMCQKYKTLFA